MAVLTGSTCDFKQLVKYFKWCMEYWKMEYYTLDVVA